VSGSVEDRYLEYVDHLHEHFVVPTDVRNGRYWPPGAPGAGMEMHAASLEQHRFAGE
jgi:L-fuconate dehydratase